jgi:hypothetical protein
MQNFTVKVEPTNTRQVGGYLWTASVCSDETVVSDLGYSVEGAILNVLYSFASYCVKNSLTSDCIEAEQRDRLQVYIEQINGVNSQ